MATASITYLGEQIARRWPGTRTEIYACRRIRNGEAWSQHAWGNAIDVFGAPGDLEEIYRWAVAHPLASDICYRGRGGCTTPHNDHVHISGVPKLAGTPPCAKGEESPNLSLPGYLQNLPALDDLADPEALADILTTPTPTQEGIESGLFNEPAPFGGFNPLAFDGLTERVILTIVGAILAVGGGVLLFRSTAINALPTPKIEG